MGSLKTMVTFVSFSKMIAKKDGVQESDVYGAEHLLRLFGKQSVLAPLFSVREDFLAPKFYVFHV